MKLAAIYNVFDAEELLPYSIQSIKHMVDEIVIVYQTVSNCGNKHPNDSFDNSRANSFALLISFLLEPE